jgi:hypothetical protein
MTPSAKRDELLALNLQLKYRDNVPTPAEEIRYARLWDAAVLELMELGHTFDAANAVVWKLCNEQAQNDV